MTPRALSARRVQAAVRARTRLEHALRLAQDEERAAREAYQVHLRPVCRPCRTCGVTTKVRHARCRACRRAEPSPSTQDAVAWDADVFMRLWLARLATSQRQLARRLGCSAEHLRHWLSGYRVARPATQAKLSAKLREHACVAG